MKGFCVSTTRMPADVLRLALKYYGLPPELITVQQAYPLSSDAENPKVIVIQPGGLRALHDMGCDVQRLIARGVTLDKALILNSAKKPVVEFDASAISARYRPLWIPTAVLRQEFAECARSSSQLHVGGNPITPESSDVNHKANGWKKFGCPGILLRTLQGALSRMDTLIVWDGQDVYSVIAPVAHDRMLLFAVAHPGRTYRSERARCAEVLDHLPQTLRAYFQNVGSVREEQWFPLDFIGYRPCWDGDILRWGPTVLRLHPLTGQWISYWAIQANQLAREIATARGRGLPRFLRHLDDQHRRMFWTHMKSLNFYLRPTLSWHLVHRQYLWALRHSGVLRRRTMRRATLLQ